MTDRTDEPPQDARGTARHNNTSSPDLGELVARLREWPSDSKDAVNWLSAQALMHAAADALAASNLRAEERDRIVADMSRRIDNWQQHAKDQESAILAERAKSEALEKERDGLHEALQHAYEKVTSACIQRDASDSRVSNLKAKVAGVLEPFLRPVKDIMPHWPDDDYATLEALVLDPLTIGDFRRAAELHAAIWGAGGMSTSNFDPRDRLDNRPVCPPGALDRIRLMARSGGFVMVRKSRCTPFVLTEKQWAKLPLYKAEDRGEQASTSPPSEDRR